MKWQYKFEVIKTAKKNMLIQKLNELGSEGWEIVHYNENPPIKFGEEIIYNILLKRNQSTLLVK